MLPLYHTYLKEPRGEDSQGWDQNRGWRRRLVIQRNAQIIPDLQTEKLVIGEHVHWHRSCGFAVCLNSHLGQVLPKFTQVVKDLSVDFWVLDAVHISQDTQHPSPHHCGNICVPSSQRAARHHATVLTGELTRFWNKWVNENMTESSYKVFHIHKHD